MFSVHPMLLIGAVIVLFAVFGMVRQARQTKQARAAFASPDATALVRGERGLFLTDVDGRPLFVPEIALTPGPHRLTFQVTQGGGLVDLPPVDAVLAEGLTLAGGRARTAATWPCGWARRS